MSADIILYALVAAGLVFWLKSILGTRDDDDQNDRPGAFSDMEQNDHNGFSTPQKNSDKAANVVSLDAVMGRGGFSLPRHIRIDNKTTENKLEDLIRKHPEFNFQHFIGGAQDAFTIIIEAFADGDLEVLEDLLVEPVYKAFEATIKEREKRGEKVQTEVVSIEKMDIVSADLNDTTLMITVRFTAREVCVIRDKEDNILSGDPDRQTQMVDVWVFGRDLKAKGPEWHLYETRDDEVEDHKTPIPEAGKDKE